MKPMYSVRVLAKRFLKTLSNVNAVRTVASNATAVWSTLPTVVS